MKINIYFLFIIALFSTPNTWAHTDIAWDYPLNIQCEQLDNKQNSWTTRHLFSFQHEGNPNFHDSAWLTAIVTGKYKSHLFTNPKGEEKEFRSNVVEGIASFEASNIQDLYNISAMGFIKDSDTQSGIPHIVLGADVMIGTDEVTNNILTSQFNSLQKYGRLAPRSYSAKCRVLTAAEAEKF